MNDKRSCEIHLASDVISPRLDNAFRELGFERDAFIGGTTGIVHPCHYTADPDSISAMEALWARAMSLLSSATESEFQGYAEGEITAGRHRVEFNLKPYDASVPFPFEPFEFETCPLDRHKDFDIHVTADLATIDEDLRARLEGDCGFHFVDIRKPSGKVVRVYTIQPLGPGVSPKIFQPLLTYFNAAGGLDGKIKLEVCTKFVRIPKTAAVPPIVKRLIATPEFVSHYV